MGLGEGTQRGAACEMRVLKSLSGKRRGPWGRCLIFSLFLKVTHVTFYLCQLIEQRSLLITSGTREEQAGMLSTELTALDVTELWRWETRAGSEHELATFLLPKPHGLVTRRADVQHPHALPRPCWGPGLLLFISDGSSSTRELCRHPAVSWELPHRGIGSTWFLQPISTPAIAWWSDSAVNCKCSLVAFIFFLHIYGFCVQRGARLTHDSS